MYNIIIFQKKQESKVKHELELKHEKKRKHKNNKNQQEALDVPNKKVKLSNGFIVETCKQVAPSVTNEFSIDSEMKENNGRHTGNEK